MKEDEVWENIFEHIEEFDVFIEDLKKASQHMQNVVAEELTLFVKPLLEFDMRAAHYYMSLALDPRHVRMTALLKLFKATEKTQTAARSLCKQYENLVIFPHIQSFIQSPTQSTTETEVHEESLFSNEDLFDNDPYQVAANEFRQYQRLASQIPPSELATMCPLKWWKEHHRQFPHVSKLARIILSIVPSQIENERIFSIAGVITTVKRNRLGTDKLNDIIYINKNFPNDPLAKVTRPEVTDDRQESASEKFEAWMESESRRMEELEALLDDEERELYLEDELEDE